MGYIYENADIIYIAVIIYGLADLIFREIKLRKCGHLIEAFSIKQEGAWGMVIVYACVVLTGIMLVLKSKMERPLFVLSLIMFSIMLVSSIRIALTKLKIYENYLVLPLGICEWDRIMKYEWGHKGNDQSTELSIYVSSKPKFLFREGKRWRIKIKAQYINRIDELLSKKV